MSVEEVLSLAFVSTERLREELVSEQQIRAAQLRYLEPVFGRLYRELTAQRYADFVSEYLKPALAWYVRGLVIAGLPGYIGSGGILQGETDYAEAASLQRQDRLRRDALRMARGLLKRALRYVEANPGMFPEYDSRDNVLNKVSLDGGIVL